ncbi:30S ribosomal protein S20 [Acetobacterium bakii]|uniref:Small ribosomal subunit protein bS20 n=1 Tax=Acetobacterium bakii TaxID=52689 RepID=A0A0L6TXZ1_9FIRM|nr:30S ribosomal protein S20 [Acetobacterium bakii]KNZ40425.1 30S ribosomal protein S20 [Acetobacterium bakii]
MANIKSAMKRAKTNETSRIRNKIVKTNLKTTVKKFELAATEGNAEEAQAAYRLAAKKIDMAVTKGILHKNTAARKKSTLARILNGLTA